MATLTLAAHLDLGGRGIRALEFVPEFRTYVVTVGSFDDTRNFQLYWWSGAMRDAAAPMTTNALADINPEELLATSASGASCRLDVFSDDGDVLVRGKNCKKVKDKTLRSFRAAASEPRQRAEW
jgi:hypothetical protein